jgi:hypothetical protein
MIDKISDERIKEDPKSLRPSLPEELEPLKSVHINRSPEQRANICAAIDIARKYLYVDEYR